MKPLMSVTPRSSTEPQVGSAGATVSSTMLKTPDQLDVSVAVLPVTLPAGASTRALMPKL